MENTIAITLDDYRYYNRCVQRLMDAKEMIEKGGGYASKSVMVILGVDKVVGKPDDDGHILSDIPFDK